MSGPPQPKQGPRKAKKSEAEFSKAVKAEVLRRSGGRCEAKVEGCWGKATLFHHKLRRSHGGPGSADNAMHLCHWCHTHVHNNVAEAEERGWLVRSRS